LERSWVSSARAASRSSSARRARRRCASRASVKGAGRSSRSSRSRPARGRFRCGAGPARRPHCAQLLELAGCVVPDPGGFGGLGDGGPLGFLPPLGSIGYRGVPGGLGGFDGVVSVGLGSRDRLLSLAPDALGLGGVGGGGVGEPVVGLAGLLLLLGRVVGIGAHLADDGSAALGLGPACLGSRGPLLGGSPGGFNFGCSGVGHGRHGTGEPVGGRRKCAAELAHLAEQLGVGHPGHGDGLVGVGVTGGHTALSAGQ